MNQEPYASAKRVFWIVDNGSSHRGQAAADRLATRYPNAVMVHTPVHGSWINQIEIFFSIVQRKVVSPNNFTSLDQVEARLIAFERRYNATARPFRRTNHPVWLLRHEVRERCLAVGVCLWWPTLSSRLSSSTAPLSRPSRGGTRGPGPEISPPSLTISRPASGSQESAGSSSIRTRRRVPSSVLPA
ncbi:transposase [Microtetraspora malaysiensis]|uniref:transposase n=1 Tax=Microtetraspora malaysiensis TaxID=161358 RepID=UPI001C3F40A9